jgi:hypothetical protein
VAGAGAECCISGAIASRSAAVTRHAHPRRGQSIATCGRGAGHDRGRHRLRQRGAGRGVLVRVMASDRYVLSNELPAT